MPFVMFDARGFEPRTSSEISAGSSLKAFCRGRSQYKCQSRHKQHTKSHHYNCDGVVSGNLEHRETPKIADRPVWSRNGRRWIFASSRKRKTTFSASEAHCQDQDCSKLLSSNFLGEMGQRDGTDWGLQASHETGRFERRATTKNNENQSVCD
jgi:hypothetical protein